MCAVHAESLSASRVSLVVKVLKTSKTPENMAWDEIMMPIGPILNSVDLYNNQMFYFKSTACRLQGTR